MVTEDVVARVVSYIQHQGAKTPDDLAALVGESQQRLFEVMSGVPEDVATRSPAEGEWSVRQLLLHVIDAERGVTRLVERLARGEEVTREPAPGVVAADDGRPYAALIDELRAANTGMVEMVRSLTDDRNLTVKAPHPFFGPLNCAEWAAFQRVHDADHIQHAEKILAAVRV
ncbi:MAG: DinB family protein [Dehalococcoidia bacterium]